MTFVNPKIVRSVLNLIPNGQFFLAVFEKSDGTIREMLCQKGVKKHVKGTGKPRKANPSVQIVYEQNVEGYRAFNVHRVFYLKALGTEIGSRPEPVVCK